MSKAASGKNLADFRRAHDKSFIVPQKIKAGLDSLGAAWEYEIDFAKRCGVSTADMAAYRSQFEPFWLIADRSANKKAWAGTKGFADRLRVTLGVATYAKD